MKIPDPNQYMKAFETMLDGFIEQLQPMVELHQKMIDVRDAVRSGEDIPTSPNGSVVLRPDPSPRKPVRKLRKVTRRRTPGRESFVVGSSDRTRGFWPNVALHAVRGPVHQPYKDGARLATILNRIERSITLTDREKRVIRKRRRVNPKNGGITDDLRDWHKRVSSGLNALHRQGHVEYIDGKWYTPDQLAAVTSPS